MRMRRLVAVLVVALLALVVSGCTSVVDGTAVAGEEPGTGVEFSGDGFGVELGTSTDAQAEVFIELQCPHCANFFSDYADEVLDQINDGNLTFTIRPVTFLDDDFVDYSARASNAVFLVAEQSGTTPTLVMDFVAGLYDLLLSSEVVPLDDDLARVASDAGADDDTVNRIAAGEPAVDTMQMSDTNMDVMDQIGATGTPAVYDLVDETEVDINDAGWLDEMVGE